MHKNELVNVLSSARSEMRRHQERVARLRTPSVRDRIGIDAAEAEEVDRLLDMIIRELDEAITRRSIGR